MLRKNKNLICLQIQQEHKCIRKKEKEKRTVMEKTPLYPVKTDFEMCEEGIHLENSIGRI